MQTEGFLLTQKGNPEKAFQLSSIVLPKLKEKEVLIQTEAFGLNYADVMARLGFYREAPNFPCVIGYEVVGKIVEIGADVDLKFLGKRVVAFTRFGGYAKHVITSENAIEEIGETPVNDALALATQGVTAYYMSHYIAPIKKGENVLIHAAAGGVGSLLIQLAKHAQANVIAKASSDMKLKHCEQLGADFTINYRKEDYVHAFEKMIGKKCLDVSYNPVGGSTFKQDAQLLNAGGRLFLFGGSELAQGKWGKLSQLNFLKKMGIVIPVFQMMQSKSIIGVNMLKIADNKPLILKECLTNIVDLYKKKIVVTQNGGDFQFTELNKAHSLLESGKSIGKIAVHW